jgi:DNA (cytosine-5)-methyltransferase 1
MLTIGSLFSGIGGLERGLEMCGLGPVLWQCDNDPCSRAVLAEHWPGVRRYDDVRDIDETAERVDIVCGGFPCQPVSVAGKRKAQSDTRWLWPFFANVIQRLRPSVVFIENVPGLRTAGLHDVLADLAAIGFDAEWGCFAAAEAGAPHRRRRLFILAYSDRERLRHEHGRGAGASREAAIQPEFAGPPWVAPYANREGRLQSDGTIQPQWRWASDGDRWTFESPVPGVAHGIPRRMDRHRLAGNAVVPQQAALAWRELTSRLA